MACFPTREELINFGIDAETWARFINGDIGVANLNRDGVDVQTLLTWKSEINEWVNNATFRRPFYTLAAAQAYYAANPGDRDELSIVFNDTAENNGSYFWDTTTNQLEKTVLQPLNIQQVIDTLRISEPVEVDTPPERGFAALNNGAVAYPPGAAGDDISGLTIPAGQTGATAYAFLLEYVDQKVRDDLAGATLRFHFIYTASAGFLAAKPLNPAPVFRHILGSGSSTVAGDADLVSETQEGTTVVRIVDYVVPANVTSWGPHLQIATGATAAGASHFIDLESFNWSIIKMPVGSTKSIIDAQLEFRLAGLDEAQADIAALDERLYDETRTSLQVYDKLIPDRGYVALRNGAVTYPIGSAQPNVPGFFIPAGQTARTTYAFVLDYVDSNIVTSFAGATLRFTFQYEATAGFLAAFPLVQGSVFRHALDGGGSVIAAATLVSQSQVGTVLTRVVDYVLPNNVTSWGPYLEIASTAAPAGVDHYIALRSFRCVIQSLLDGSEQTLMDAQLDLKLADLDFQPSDRAIVPTLSSDELDTVLGSNFQFVAPQFTVNKLGQSVSSPATTITVPQPGTEEVNNLAFSLIYAPPNSATPGLSLPHQYASDVVVTRVSDGAVLVEGAEYAIKPNTGYIYGLINLPPVACTISYTGHMHRYDLLVVNESTAALTRVQGTERAIDPEEYKPVAPTGTLLAQTLYVSKNGVDRLQSWRFDDYRDKLGTRAYDDWLKYCQQALPKTFQKLRDGDPIRVIGYGSSSVDMGLGSANQLTPNVGRDRKIFYTRIPADTLASYPSYGPSDPDFAGSAYTDHTKTGFAWQMILAMREQWLSDITYRNWGVGGSTSEATIQTNGIMNGRYPARLDAMLADDGDLMILAFANGLGASWQYDNAKAIIEAFQATGGEVIVVTPQRLNIYGNGSPGDVSWRQTTNDLVRAAMDTGSAFVNAGLISAPGLEGGSGVSPHNMTNGNLYNHDGPLRLIQTGELMGQLFEDYEEVKNSVPGAAQIAVAAANEAVAASETAVAAAVAFEETGVKKPELASATGTELVAGALDYPNAITRTQQERDMDTPVSADFTGDTYTAILNAANAIKAEKGGGVVIVPAGTIVGGFQTPPYDVMVEFHGPEVTRGQVGGLGGDSVRFKRVTLTYMDGPHPTSQVHAHHHRVIAKGSNQIGAQFCDAVLGITIEKQNWSGSSAEPVAGEINGIVISTRNGRAPGDPIKTGGASILNNSGATDGAGMTQFAESVNSVFARPGLNVIKQSNIQIHAIDTETGDSYVMKGTSNVGMQSFIFRFDGTTASRWNTFLALYLDSVLRFRISDVGGLTWRRTKSISLLQEDVTNDMVMSTEEGREIARFSESKGVVQTGQDSVNRGGATILPLMSDIGQVIAAFHTAPMVMTLPNSMPKGYVVEVVQRDAASQVTFTPETGATLRCFNGHTKTAGIHATVKLRVSTNSTGTNAVWYMSGDTAA